MRIGSVASRPSSASRSSSPHELSSAERAHRRRTARRNAPSQSNARIAMLWSLASAVMLACGGSGGDGAVAVSIDNGVLTVVGVSDCPPCDALATDTAYGRFSFSSGATGQTAAAILQICGFQNVSPSQSSLQIRGCSGGLELAFVSSQLRAFALRDGFGGTFNATIRIGDPLEAVLAADPGLVQVDPLTFVRDDGSVRIEANFDDGLRLRELVVGRGFVR